MQARTLLCVLLGYSEGYSLWYFRIVVVTYIHTKKCFSWKVLCIFSDLGIEKRTQVEILKNIKLSQQVKQLKNEMEQIGRKYFKSHCCLVFSFFLYFAIAMVSFVRVSNESQRMNTRKNCSSLSIRTIMHYSCLI